MTRLFGVSLLMLGATLPAHAAAPPPLACDGQIVIVYHEKVKSGGSLDGIIEAAKAQEAWYRAQGMNDNKVVVARVVKYDAKTKQSAYATDELYNFHINPPARVQAPEKAQGAKPDYIAKYRANATVIDRATICLPKF